MANSAHAQLGLSEFLYKRVSLLVALREPASCEGRAPFAPALLVTLAQRRLRVLPLSLKTRHFDVPCPLARSGDIEAVLHAH
jgi:hypothetical protein